MDPNDAIIQETERDIQRLYSQAQKEVQDKLTDYLNRFAAKDKIKLQQLANGKITIEQYNYWRKGQICIGQRWQETLDTLTQDYINADKIAISIVNEHMPEAYAVGHNYGTFQVERDSLVDTSYTLYDHQTVERLIRDNPDLLPDLPPKVAINIPKDRRWNKTHIKDMVTQSILQGESVKGLAKRMQIGLSPRYTIQDIKDANKKTSAQITKELARKNKSAALRNARTALTGAHNAGRIDSYIRASKMGIQLKYEWLATLDGRTRHSHRQLDGEKIVLGGRFSNKCRYPGDPMGPPSEVYNCRCTLVPAIEGFDQSNAPRDNKLDGMTYDEWKNELLNKQNNNPYSEERKANALDFDNREEADKYLRPQLDKSWEELTDTEKYGVWKYTQNSNPMNKALSGYEGSWTRDSFKGVGNAKWSYEDNWRYNPEQFKKFGHSDGTIDHARSIAAATRAIDKITINDDMYLYRGSDSNGLAGLIEGDVFSFDDALSIVNTGNEETIKQAFIGQRFVNHAFTSTAIASNAGFGGNISYRIYAPKGTHGLYAEPQSAYGNTVGNDENPDSVTPRLYHPGIKRNSETVGYEAEIILQRGTEYQITNIEFDEDGNINVDMQIVSQPNYFKSGYEQTIDMAA